MTVKWLISLLYRCNPKLKIKARLKDKIFEIGNVYSNCDDRIAYLILEE